MERRESMTKILIGEDFCEISGHAPDPVVCHGISAIAQMVGNYLERDRLGTVEVRSGYMKIIQNERCRRIEGIGVLLGAAYRAFVDIANEYPGNVEIELAGKEDWP